MTSRLEEVNLPSPGWLVSFEGWCRRGDSASVSGAGRLGTWWHQEPNQPWSRSPCCQAHAQSPYLPLWLLCKCTLISVIPQGRQVFFQFRILARLVRGQFQKLLLDLPTHPTGQGTKVGLLPTTKYIYPNYTFRKDQRTCYYMHLLEIQPSSVVRFCVWTLAEVQKPDRRLWLFT